MLQKQSNADHRQIPKAKSDLVEIWSYIADDSEIRADAFVQTIDKKFHNLGGFNFEVQS